MERDALFQESVV